MGMGQSTVKKTAMLEKFRVAKQDEIERLLLREKEGGTFQINPSIKRGSFSNAIHEKNNCGKRAIIAEYKRASPSLGEINMNASPEEIAQVYARSGACAISVLTEEHYFCGSLDYLERAEVAGLPLLRKDFIFHPVQIAQTAESSAAAVLVIVRMLEDKTFHAILEKCRDYGIEPVVEVFSESDLYRAQDADVSIIQVNNRDLDTLKIDLSTSSDLIRRKRNGEIWISASGLNSQEQVMELQAIGFNAFLVGSSLMKSSSLEKSLATLCR